MNVPALETVSSPPDDTSQKKLRRQSELKEVKYSLRDLLDETDAEKQASTMSRQIVDQTEIQKMLKDFEKKSSSKV